MALPWCSFSVGSYLWPCAPLGCNRLQIVSIYVHLSRGDDSGAFAEAISADGRSYRVEVQPPVVSPGYLRELGFDFCTMEFRGDPKLEFAFCCMMKVPPPARLKFVYMGGTKAALLAVTGTLWCSTSSVTAD